MRTKLHELLAQWPDGGVRVVSSVKKEGYSQSLLNRYRYAGWFKSVGDGALAKGSDTPTIFGAVSALQNDLKLEIHVGGLSALELRGYAHYVRAGLKKVWLFGREKKLPKWFTHYKWNEEVEYRTKDLFDRKLEDTFVEYVDLRNGPRVRVSHEARAMFEYLSLVPRDGSVTEAKELMQGLTAAPPVMVNKLLSACTSIKVKRLFLLLAEECGHAWMKRVDVASIDLGKGNRNLTRGGRLHPKYKITVPASIFSEVEK